jgi:hypothetical protein
MKHYRDLGSQSFESANFAVVSIEKIVGKHFDCVYLVEVLENARGELRTPSDTNSILGGWHHFSSRTHRIRRRNRYRSHRHNWKKCRWSLCWKRIQNFPSQRQAPDE